MEKTEEQKELDKELFRECQGYSDRDIKPDGAYIQDHGRFFNINKIKRLIEAGADVNAKDEWGYSPLYWAVFMDNLELSKLLIEVGADVNAEDDEGMSPLHVAVERNNVALAEYLISAGANINAKYKHRSPLSLLLSDNVLLSDKKLKIVKLLFKAGATE